MYFYRLYAGKYARSLTIENATLDLTSCFPGGIMPHEHQASLHERLIYADMLVEATPTLQDPRLPSRPQ